MPMGFDTPTDKGVSGEDISPSSVTTGNLAVTDDTLVRAEVTTDQSINAATFEPLDTDTLAKDERGEYNLASNEFTPDETGWYLVIIAATFQVAADQDSLIIDLKNGNLRMDSRASGTGFEGVVATSIVNISSTTTVQPRVRNQTSSDTINGNGDRSFFAVRRAFR